MSVIAERTQIVMDLIESVKDHCMCARFEDDGTTYRVIYPEGYFPEGVQCSQGMGKAVALEKMLEVMERHWKESFL